MTALKGAAIAYYRKVHEEVVELAQAFLQKPSAEVLHNLRVQLKRMRFIRNLVRRHVVGVDHHLFRHYHRLFDRAGSIRAHQMNRYRLAGQELPPPDRYEKHEIKRLSQRLPKIIERLRADALNILPLLQQAHFPSANSFLHDLHQRLRRRLHASTRTYDLHSCRKLLKEVTYSAELASAFAQKLQLWYNPEVISELEDKIGDWHDLALALETKHLSHDTREKLMAQKKQKLDLVYQLVKRMER